MGSVFQSVWSHKLSQNQQLLLVIFKGHFSTGISEMVRNTEFKGTHVQLALSLSKWDFAF